MEQLVRSSSDLLSDQGVKTATVVIENGSLKKRAKVPLTRALLNPAIGSMVDVEFWSKGIVPGDELDGEVGG